MYSKEGVVAIIQARFSSTRLTGKVLIPISRKPMLWHVVNRLKRSNLINKVVIATTTEKRDNIIVKFCIENNIDFYRGSENDVLDRYYQVAKKYKVDVIVRITADCPLIDPEITDKVIEYYLKNKDRFDYVSNVLERSFPRGLDVEVFSFNVLEKTWHEARETHEREHVTPYICEHPEMFRLTNVENSKDLSYMRWTVDEEKDLEFVREVYQRLYQGGKIFYMNDVLNLLDKEQELLEINKDVKQKDEKN